MQTGNNAKEYLTGYIQRIEHLEEEKKEIGANINEVFKEAEGNGFDKKAMKQILKLRKMDAIEREEFESTVDVYKNALGMLFDTPLGQSAFERNEAA